LIVVIQFGHLCQASAIQKRAIGAVEIAEQHFEFRLKDATMMSADDVAGELEIAIGSASKIEERFVDRYLQTDLSALQQLEKRLDLKRNAAHFQELAQV